MSFNIIILNIIILINCVINGHKFTSQWIDDFTNESISKAQWIFTNDPDNCQGKLHFILLK